MLALRLLVSFALALGSLRERFDGVIIPEYITDPVAPYQRVIGYRYQTEMEGLINRYAQLLETARDEAAFVGLYHPFFRDQASDFFRSQTKTQTLFAVKQSLEAEDYELLCLLPYPIHRQYFAELGKAHPSLQNLTLLYAFVCGGDSMSVLFMGFDGEQLWLIAPYASLLTCIDTEQYRFVYGILHKLVALKSPPVHKTLTNEEYHQVLFQVSDPYYLRPPKRFFHSALLYRWRQWCFEKRWRDLRRLREHRQNESPHL